MGKVEENKMDGNGRLKVEILELDTDLASTVFFFFG